MLKIEKKLTDSYPFYTCDVYIDGELINKIDATAGANNSKYQLKIFTKHMTEKFFEYPIDYFLPQVDSFEFVRCLSWLDEKYFEGSVKIEMHENKNVENTVSVDIFPQVADWNLSFSIGEYIEGFNSIWNKIKDKDFPFEDDVEWRIDKYAEDYQISLSNDFYLYFSGESLKQILTPLIDAVRECHVSTVNLLTKGIDKSINEKFQFPIWIKSSCEQYLFYFAQFLRDLGINATSNLKEEAGKVLFSVTPTNDVEALDKIREALAVYLNLPSSPIVYDESFASMRLKQQVDNLQHAQRMTEMEFRLAQKVIESQDRIIQQKDSTIEQQSKIIEKIADKAVMINSAENKEELEELFEGVKIGKSKFLAEQGGLHLNPLTALKSVGKKLVGKDDEIISLNLNEETDLQN